MTHSSSESFVRSEDSASYADTLDSTSADSDMRSDAELRHDMSFDFDTASVAESGGSRWRHIHHTQQDTDGRLGHSLSFNAFPTNTRCHIVLRQRTASPLAEVTETEVKDQHLFPYTCVSACPCYTFDCRLAAESADGCVRTWSHAASSDLLLIVAV